MADDITKLVLQLSVDFKSMERQMKKAGVVTRDATNAIQKDFVQTGNVIDAQTQRIDKSMRQAQNATQNLSFQFSDIAQGLASGTSPFTLMVQQTGQIGQALDGLGKGSLFKGLFGALRSVLSLQNVVVAGVIYGVSQLSSAVSDYFNSTEKDAKEADELWKRHAEVVSSLKEAYKAAAEGKSEFAEKSVNVAAFDASVLRDSMTEIRRKFGNEALEISVELDPSRAVEKMRDLQKALTEASLDNDAKLVKKLQKEIDNLKTSSGQAEQGFRRLSEKFKVLPQEVQELVLEVEKGEASFTTLDEALAKFGKDASPAIRKIVNDMRALIAQAVTTERKIKELDQSVRQLEERQDKYNKALQEMKSIGTPSLTEAQKILQQHAIALANARDEAERYVATLAMTNAFRRLEVASSGALGASLTSGADDFTRMVSHIESRGNNAAQSNSSSASGLFGFIDSTFVRIVRSLDGFAHASDEAILAQKSNVELQKRAFAELTRQNAEALAQAGKPINDTTRYLAHFLGSAGAVRALNADPGASAESVLGADAARANPTVIGGGRTIQDVIDFAAKKVGAARASLGADSAREENEELRENLTIRNEISASIDKKVQKEQAALKLAELTREAQKKAREEGRVLTAAETAELKKQADEWGRLKGLEAGAKQAEDFTGRMQSLREENELLAQQVAQLGASTVAIDQNKVAQEAANEALKIEQSLRAQGTIATSQQSAAILALTTSIATSKAQIDAYERSQKKLSSSQEKFNQMAVQTAQSAFSGFINDLRNGVSAADAFRNALDRVIDGMINMTIESMFAEDALGGVIKKLFSGFGGGGLLSVGTKHRGTGGGVTDMRRVSPATFAGAPRLHNGLQPGEFPAILQQGERVIPRSQVRRGAGSGGGNVYLGDVQVDVATGMVTASNEDARDLGRQIDTAVQAVLVRESRPGGLLRQGAR